MRNLSMVHRRLILAIVGTLTPLYFDSVCPAPSQRMECVAATRAPKIPEVDLVQSPASQKFEFVVTGLPDTLVAKLADLAPTAPEFLQLLRVQVGEVTDDTLPPVAGKYRVEEQRVIFTPRFPPKRGLTYLARVTWPYEDVNQVLVCLLTVPVDPAEQDRQQTIVRHVYPSADTVPENHLRFYIHFSQPMSRTGAYQNLQLLNDKDEPLEAPFLELGEELWDPSSQRFTLLLDPGRIKQGLKPREELGPVLEEGHRYTLVVRQAWEDAHGKPLKTEFRKTFRVGPHRQTALKIEDWKLTPPSSANQQRLSVAFPFPLDHALLLRVFRIIGPDGQPVAGPQIVCNDEKKWTFAPEQPWQTGQYHLEVDTVLEDSAGNRIGRAFEVDEFDTVTRQVVPEHVRLPFNVSAQTAAKTNP